MSASLPASVDAERMVAARRTFEGIAPVAKFPRLVRALADDSGEIAYRLDFERGQLGGLELHVRLTARLTLECQRTLEPFEWPAEVDTRLGLLASEDAMAGLPGHREPLLLDDGAVRPRRVIEDELLLALPLVPVKPGSEMLQGEWNVRARTDAEGREPATTHPFSGLRRLIETQPKQH